MIGAGFKNLARTPVPKSPPPQVTPGCFGLAAHTEECKASSNMIGRYFLILKFVFCLYFLVGNRNVVHEDTFIHS